MNKRERDVRQVAHLRKIISTHAGKGNYSEISVEGIPEGCAFYKEPKLQDWFDYPWYTEGFLAFKEGASEFSYSSFQYGDTDTPKSIREMKERARTKLINIYNLLE